MRIVVVGGASGGHAYPARTFAETFYEQVPDADVYGIFPEKIMFPWNGEQTPWWKIYRVPGRGLNFGRPWELPVVACEWFALWVTVSRQLKILQPDLIVSFGTYLTAAISAWAQKHHVPMITHEQNFLLGRANAFASARIQGLGLGFKDLAKKDRKKTRCEVRFCGQIVRRELREAAEVKTNEMQRSKVAELNVLVLGGSQGSQAVNGEVMNAVEGLSENEKKGIRFLHIAGPLDRVRMKLFYERKKVKHEVFDYCHDMAQLYKWATIVVGRAGAGTISESAVFELALILIPFPSKHQQENAAYIERNQAGEVVQAGATERKLCRVLKELITNETHRKLMARNLRNLVPCDGAENLKAWALELVGNQSGKEATFASRN